ncbi:MAG: SLC13 family permease [Gemmatimonadota bacterium]|nr:SLC13 family permease [Gemmatimonadota bacterium]
MTTPEWILVGVFVGTIGLMFGTRLRPDVVAILAALSLGLLDIIPDGGVFQGLSSTVVLTLIGLFILAEGLEDTGVIRWAAQRLSTLGEGGDRRLLLTLMGTAALLSLGMNNVAVGALFLPASIRIARSSGMPASSLLMPVSYATLLGGMATIFTSANIIMSDLLLQQGSEPLGMMDFVVTGGLVAVAGIAYMLTFGYRLLPEREKEIEDPYGDFFGLYKLGERFWEFEVQQGSRLDGKTIEEIGFREHFGLSVLAIRRRARTFLVPGPGIAIVPGDRVVVLGHKDRVRELVPWGVELRTGISPGDLQEELELTEIVVPPRSRATGRTLTELELRTKYGLTVLALWREGRIIRTDVGKTPLEIGDGLLVVNLPQRLDALTRGGDFLLVGSSGAAPERPERAPLAVAIFGLVVAVAFTGLLPIGETVLAGAMAMILTRCVTMEQAYRSVEWHVIFLVAGLLPLGFAMIDTGLADRIAGALGDFLGTGRPLLAVATMFAVSAGATQVIGGQVSALLVGPVALAVATTSGVPPQPMAVAVAIGASTAFMTPMAHPVNAMMMGTGGYRSRDFARVGAGMTLVTLVTLLAGMWLFWGLR